MMATDLTKFTIVVVLLGITLAMAIFRPQILPVEVEQSTAQPTQTDETATVPEQDADSPPSPTDLLVSEKELSQRESEVNQLKYELNQRQAELDQRQIELDERQRDLDQRQAGLDEREDSLDRLQIKLDERKVSLEEQAATFQMWEQRLARQKGLLETTSVRLLQTEVQLRKWEVRLTEQEQQLEGRLRVSVAALILSIPTNVPLAAILVAQMRKDRRTLRAETQAAPAKARWKGQIPDHDRHDKGWMLCHRPGEVGSSRPDQSEAIYKLYSQEGKEAIVPDVKAFTPPDRSDCIATHSELRTSMIKTAA